MKNNEASHLAADDLLQQLRQEAKRQYLQEQTEQTAKRQPVTDASALQAQSDAMRAMAQANSQSLSLLTTQLQQKDQQLDALLDQIDALEEENRGLRTEIDLRQENDDSHAGIELSRTQKPVIELLWRLVFKAGIRDAAKSDLARLFAYITGYSEKKVYNLLKGENHVALERSSAAEVKRVNALLYTLGSEIQI